MKLSRFAAFIFVSIFGILFIAIHFLRPDLYFLKYPLSRYTIGEYGILMCMGFISFGLSEILLGYNIMIQSGKLNRTGILVIIAGIGVFLATFFSMDIQHKPTMGGNLHFLGALIQFVVFPFFCLVSFKDFLKGGFKKMSLVVSITTFFFCFLLTVAISLKNDILFSIAEKVDILVFTVWLMIVELDMIRKSNC